MTLGAGTPSESPRNDLLHALARLDTPARLAALEDWEERSALMEYVGGMPRREAEREAMALVRRRLGL